MSPIHPVVVSLAVAACFDYQPHAGLPCSPSRRCPEPLICDTNDVCVIDPQTIPDAPDQPDADPTLPDGATTSFGVPQPIAELNSGDDDLGPTVIQDQSLIVFTSNRDADYALFASQRTMSGYTPPVAIAELDVAGIEYDGDLAADGGELHYISSATPDGVRRVTRMDATQTWQVPPSIGVANCEGPSLFAGELRMIVSTSSGIDEYERMAPGATWTFVRGHDALDGHSWPGISQDGLELFATDASRLYRATRSSLDDEFGPPQRVLFGGPIDRAPMADPELSHDGKTLYLVIQTTGGFDIHVATRL